VKLFARVSQDEKLPFALRGLELLDLGGGPKNFERSLEGKSGNLMRIAQGAPLFECIPPKYYGGTERVVSYLTEELVCQDAVRAVQRVPELIRKQRQGVFEQRCIATRMPHDHFAVCERLIKSGRHQELEVGA
jgi:hypothetical protein